MGYMLVKLDNLPNISPIIEEFKSSGIVIRRPIAPEKHAVSNWIREEFKDGLENYSAGWADECEVAFSNHPVSCFTAIKDGKIIGVACYDSTYKNFFGPEGISKEFQGMGIGKALLLSCLHAMAEEGYAFAIIPTASAMEFYSKVAGAVMIENTGGGIYIGLLKK